MTKSTTIQQRSRRRWQTRRMPSHGSGRRRRRRRRWWWRRRRAHSNRMIPSRAQFAASTSPQRNWICTLTSSASTARCGTLPLQIALRLPSAPRPEEAVARLGRSARPRSCSTSRTTTRCRSSARSGRESAAHSKSHGTTASAFLFCAARAASTCESRCGWSRTCH